MTKYEKYTIALKIIEISVSIFIFLATYYVAK